MSEKFRPLKRPKQKRSLETFNAILEAALLLLKSEGYAVFTTNKIAEKAGVSISSLYQYFPNKEAILGELIIDFIKDQDESIIGKLDELPEESTFKDNLFCLISSLVDFNESNKDMCRIIYSNVSNVGRVDEVSEIDKGTLELLRTIFLKYEIEVREQDPDILLKIIFHSIRGVYASIHTQKNAASFDSETLKNELLYLAYRYLT